MIKLLNPILLTGMKHCGKSSTARLLSGAFAVDFIDLDEAAEQLYGRDYGKELSSREIYREHGRDFFREMELKASRLIAAMTDAGPVISAAGGGLCDNGPAVDCLKSSFIFIYIDEAADVLYRRIITGGIPAFLSAEKPYEDFLDLYARRTAEYGMLSDIHIKAGGRPSAAVADDIINRLMEEGYAG